MPCPRGGDVIASEANQYPAPPRLLRHYAPRNDRGGSASQRRSHVIASPDEIGTWQSHRLNSKSQNPNDKQTTNSKYLNAKDTSVCYLAFELDLTFELCHLILFAPVLGLSKGFGAWDLSFRVVGAGLVPARYFCSARL